VWGENQGVSWGMDGRGLRNRLWKGKGKHTMRTICTAQEAKSKLSNFEDRDFRQYQEDVIKFVTQSKRKFKVVSMPTGGGKSLIGMICGIMAQQANYLCSTKILQTQLASDFPEAKSLFGRGNYVCLLNESKNCDQCISTRSFSTKCPDSSSCLYKIAKQEAIESSLRILNYNYFLSETQYVGKMSGTPLTIIDEVDALEGTLINQISLQFTERSLFRLGLQDGPYRKTVKAKDGIESWKEFGKEAMNRAEKLSASIMTEIMSFDQITEDWQFRKFHEYDHFYHLYERAKMFIDNVDRDWIMDRQERQGSRQARTIFRPLWITNELAELFMWSKSDNFLLMSATFLPKLIFCKTLGLDPDEVDWMETPSTFPIDRRPIHVWPVANVTNKNLDDAIPKLAKGIHHILGLHPDSHGLIQGVSYSLCKRVSEALQSERIRIHTPQDRQEVLDEFINSNSNSVVLSPSTERGISLEGSKCDFIIWIKAPYLSLMDRIVSQRLYSFSIGQFWYRSAMMLSIVQGCGRGMRNKDDYCVSYLIDHQINKIYTKSPLIWPKWFRDAVSWDESPWEMEK